MVSETPVRGFDQAQGPSQVDKSAAWGPRTEAAAWSRRTSRPGPHRCPERGIHPGAQPSPGPSEAVFGVCS